MLVNLIAAAFGSFSVLPLHNISFEQSGFGYEQSTLLKIAQATDPHTALRNQMVKEGFDGRYLATGRVVKKSCSPSPDVIEYSIGGYKGSQHYAGYGCVDTVKLNAGWPQSIILSYRPD